MPVLAPSAASQSLKRRPPPAPSPRTRNDVLTVGDLSIPVYEQEFWTSRQRQANPLHEVSYRACFKPQLPAYFIERLTHEGDVVYDPFSGRGTTAVEAALHARNVIANDANPLSAILTYPRLELPCVSEIDKRLRSIAFPANASTDLDLSMFFHRKTLYELLGLRHYLARRWREGAEDSIDRWIRMVATNRLTGHSPGFFSVYTLPPNQAVSAENQVKINQKLGQKPEYRDVRALILRKSMQLQGGLSAADRWRLHSAAESARFLVRDASSTPAIASESVQLTVTSPPFLDVVQYARDNWLRCWFNALDAEAISERITMSTTVEEWSDVMAAVFRELYRVTRRGGWVAFEVGEVRGGKIKLEEVVAPLGVDAGFKCVAILINTQQFTKTANIWGVENNRLGTNSNRIVLFRKTR
ncbi:MAG: site-specific DNA-methyltransferase [Betaproteobacteria bacterium]|nr:site-specific DNA-methyltransferase [Betaproteobacteria bacterium]